MQERAGDTTSKETTYSGLPKCIKLITDVTALGGAAGFAAVLFDKIQFNYGGFHVTKTGAYWSTIRVVEPGLYLIAGQINAAANSQTLWLYTAINGAILHADGAYAANQIPNAMAYGGVIQVVDYTELKAGDTVELWWAQPAGGVAQPSALHYPWLYLEKKGGQY